MPPSIGTGWVCETVDAKPLTADGQIFRMRMYHPRHPDGNYQTANRVEVFEPPSAISWATGYERDNGTLGFGGWKWRYDLVANGSANNDGHFHLRLVSRLGVDTRADRIPAVSF